MILSSEADAASGVVWNWPIATYCSAARVCPLTGHSGSRGTGGTGGIRRERPICDMDGGKIPQRGSLLRVLSFLGSAGEEP
jgi:hypothetical protein